MEIERKSAQVLQMQETDIFDEQELLGKVDGIRGHVQQAELRLAACAHHLALGLHLRLKLPLEAQLQLLQVAQLVDKEGRAGGQGRDMGVEGAMDSQQS